MAAPAAIARSRDVWLDWLARAPRILPGTPEDIYREGLGLAALLDQHDILLPGRRVLDFGCGIGKLAIPLVERSLEYVGVDVRRDAVAFCKQAFAPWRNLSFEHLSVRNAYYARWAWRSPENLRLSFEAASFDSAVAISVFTHLESEAVCERALSELHRVLRPGGRLFCTWFRSPPNPPASTPARRVYAEPVIRRMLASGFDLQHATGGDTCKHDDQWCLIGVAR